MKHSGREGRRIIIRLRLVWAVWKLSGKPELTNKTLASKKPKQATKQISKETNQRKIDIPESVIL